MKYTVFKTNCCHFEFPICCVQKTTQLCYIIVSVCLDVCMHAQTAWYLYVLHSLGNELNIKTHTHTRTHCYHDAMYRRCFKHE